MTHALRVRRVRAVTGCTFALVAALSAAASAQVANDEKKNRPDYTPKQVVRPIRPIVNAPVVRAEQMKHKLKPGELVIGVVVGGQARAYPINMLTGPHREIINDTLGNRAIAATW